MTNDETNHILEHSWIHGDKECPESIRPYYWLFNTNVPVVWPFGRKLYKELMKHAIYTTGDRKDYKWIDGRLREISDK